MCSLGRGERATFSCPAASLQGPPEPPIWALPPDQHYVELDVALLSMIEVWLRSWQPLSSFLSWAVLGMQPLPSFGLSLCGS